jgi:hypothetical protein
VIGNNFLKIFRWVNLLPLPVNEDVGPKDATRVFVIESRNNPMSRMEYLNPYIGDISFEMLQDIFKVPYFTRQKDVLLNTELDNLLWSYCDFVVENWNSLEKGAYNELRNRPEINYKQMLTEEIIRDNLPELNLEERALIQMNTMDIPKDQSGMYLAESGKAPGEFKMLEAEKKSTERKVMGSKSPGRTGTGKDGKIATNT